MKMLRSAIASSCVLFFSCLLFAQDGAVRTGPTGAANSDWPVYAADLRSTKYSSLDLINPTNVRDLRIVWRWKSPDIDIVKQNPALHLNLFEATPLAIDGVLYVITNLHQVAAIDGATGNTRWVYDPGVYRLGTPERTGFVHRGVAAWGPPGARRILAGTGDGYLIALDARSGSLISEFGTDGRVDLTKGLRRPVERITYGVDSPPLVIGDIIVVGSFVSDGWSMKEAPPGDVRGYDARTGRLRWTFHTVPQPGETGHETWLEDGWRYTGNTNVWTWMSADEELGYVYLPVSTPTNDHYGGHRPGNNLFAESVVCLEAATGRLVWHFQTTHHGLWDYDLPAAPVLADIMVEGRRIHALAQLSKQGFVYVLDRRTGAPVWPIVERPVPPSQLPGEHASATQPFPTRPAPFDRQGLMTDDLIDFTPALRAEAQALVARYHHGPLYTPPDKQDTILLPGVVGGASWAGAALDPESGTLFVPSITNPRVVTILTPDRRASDMRFFAEQIRPTLTLSSGLPITKPPYGRITAIDLNSGDHRWMVPLGAGPREHRLLRGLNLPALGWASRGFVTVTRSLLLVTQDPAVSVRLSANGRVFELTATTREPKLWALAKDSGQVLGSIDLPANAGGSQMTYRVGNRQFIVIPVGGGGVPPELIALSTAESSDSK